MFCQQLNTINIEAQFLFAVNYVFFAIVAFVLGETTTEFLWQELRADVTEVINQRFSCIDN